MNNSSNVTIAIAILLKWGGTRVKEGTERGKRSICPVRRVWVVLGEEGTV